jgi:hypothetical protein
MWHKTKLFIKPFYTVESQMLSLLGPPYTFGYMATMSNICKHCQILRKHEMFLVMHKTIITSHKYYLVKSTLSNKPGLIVLKLL